MLEADCAVTPELLTIRGIDSLDALEPCGNGCPKPVLVMENLTIDRISLVGNGRHTRLRLRQGYHTLNAIGFGMTPQSASIEPGDVVDVAFIPQVNEFRGERSVQLNIQDIRPSCQHDCCCDCSNYRKLTAGTISPAEADQLLPDRATLAAVWRYLFSSCTDQIRETPECLCRKIVRKADIPLSVEKMLVCLDIFRDVQLLRMQRQKKHLLIHLLPAEGKADLQESATMQKLIKAKGSELLGKL